ncbi:MAG: dTMP kinase [Lachnospiraceae bacterium]|nr:dTMP kinase [Lachnospiraceae bacterium]
MNKNEYGGLFIAFDGPNGAGKSTLIERVQLELINNGLDVCVTKEPSESLIGNFIRKIAESLEGESLACLVAADRYHHLKQTIIPELKKGKVVITDRYILSSLILQCMDNVDVTFVLAVNGKAILPDIQIAVRADVNIIQSRLNERDKLTRFEHGQRSDSELIYMTNGEVILKQMGVSICNIENSKNLCDNVSLIVNHIKDAKNERIVT